MPHDYHQLNLNFEPPGKRCGRCGEIKSPAEFHRKSASPDGLQSWCRICNTSGAKRFYSENTDHARRRIGSWIRKVDEDNKRRVLRYLREHPCVDCGEDDPVVLEFDHQRDKAHGIAQLLHAHVRWEVIAGEIAKCEVRCANCHRRRTAAAAGWFRAVNAEWAARGSNPKPSS